MSDVRIKVVNAGGKHGVVIRYSIAGGSWRQRRAAVQPDPKKKNSLRRAIRAARDEAVELRIELERKHSKAYPEMRWDDFCAFYEEKHLRTTSRSNLYKWKKVAAKFGRRNGGSNLTLDEIDQAMLVDFHSHLGSTMAAGSVPSNFATLRAGLAFAATVGAMPPLPPVRTRHIEKMRGRPLTGEEFERMLGVMPKVKHVGKDRARGFRDLARGLWLGGLRLGEACQLTWDDPSTHHLVDLHTSRPKIAFATGQKNRKFQMVAVVHPFAELLRRLPRDPGNNFVFQPMGPRGRLVTTNRVGERIREAGRLAGVITEPHEDPEKRRYAGSHDLRRSFGRRWATRAMRPVVLMHLMRHSRIETTLKYYAGVDADAISDELKPIQDSLVGDTAGDMVHDILGSDTQ